MPNIHDVMHANTPNRFPYVKEEPNFETPSTRMTIKAFNQFTFGVIHTADVVKVGKDTVTLYFPLVGRRETYPMNKTEWFFYHDGPKVGQSFTFRR